MSPETHWRPTASLAHLQRRAQLLRQIRTYFAEQGVLEVETPVLLPAAVTDPHIDSFVVLERGADGKVTEHFLQSSPEHAMKRLLAAGSGPIYQISKVFRAGESGRRHSPEFSLLEWYRPGFDHHALMDDVEALLTRLLALESRALRIGYGELFRDYLDIDPLRAGIPELQRCAALSGISIDGPDMDRDAWLELLFSHVIEPRLATRARLVFVHGYPPSQAALARIDGQGLAERFELYLNGIELANGYHELNDPREQRWRFEQDNQRRRLLGKSSIPIDELLLQALDHGMPDCAGVALGLDRLVMCDIAADDLTQVMAFPHR